MAYSDRTHLQRIFLQVLAWTLVLLALLLFLALRSAHRNTLEPPPETIDVSSIARQFPALTHSGLTLRHTVYAYTDVMMLVMDGRLERSLGEFQAAMVRQGWQVVEHWELSSEFASCLVLADVGTKENILVLKPARGMYIRVLLLVGVSAHQIRQVRSLLLWIRRTYF